jgi:NitT/TauT family transport system substrate-binding protein
MGQNIGRWSAVALATALHGCSGSGDDDLIQVVFQSKWFPQAQFAGYYVAGGHPPGTSPAPQIPRVDGQSFYAAEGLDVTVLPGGEQNPSLAVAQGHADFGSDWWANLLKTKEENGLDLVHVAQVFQRSGFELVARQESGIREYADLAGHTVGVWEFGNEFPALVCFKSHNLTSDFDEDVAFPQVTTLKYRFDPALVFPDQVDVASAMVYNELNQIVGLGYPLDTLVRLPSARHDCALLEDLIFTTAELLDDLNWKDTGLSGKEIAQRFLRATLRGWEWSIEENNVLQATDVVLEFCGETCKGSGAQSAELHQIWQMTQVRGLVQPAYLGEPEARVGCLDQDDAEQTVRLLKSVGFIQEATDTNIVDGDVLRGAGIDCP